MKKSFALSTLVKQFFYTLYPQRHTGISVCSLILFFVLGATTSYAQETTTTLSQFQQDSLMRELGFATTVTKCMAIQDKFPWESEQYCIAFKKVVKISQSKIFDSTKNLLLNLNENNVSWMPNFSKTKYDFLQKALKDNTSAKVLFLQQLELATTCDEIKAIWKKTIPSEKLQDEKLYRLYPHLRPEEY